MGSNQSSETVKNYEIAKAELRLFNFVDGEYIYHGKAYANEFLYKSPVYMGELFYSRFLRILTPHKYYIKNKELPVYKRPDIRPRLDILEEIGFQNVDEQLRDIYLAYLPYLPHEILIYPTAKQYMPFAWNSFVYTNAGTGKSTLASYFSTRFDDVSLAGLLGFADAHGVKRGILDGLTSTVFVDELQEVEDKGLYGRILNYMENGISRISKAGSQFEIEAFAPLVFLSNPKVLEKYGDTKEGLVTALVQALDKIVEGNREAVARRMALIFLNDKLKRVEGGSYTPIDIHQQYEFDALRLDLGKQFVKIFEDDSIKKWLNSPHDKEYIDSIMSFNNETTSLFGLLRGLTGNFRHIKGMALSRYLIDYYHEPIQFNMLNDILDDIKTLQLDTLKPLSTYWDDSMSAEAVEYIKKIYIRAFLDAINDAVQRNVLIEGKWYKLDLNIPRDSDLYKQGYRPNAIWKRIKEKQMSVFGVKIDKMARKVKIDDFDVFFDKYESAKEYVNEVINV